MKYGMKDKADDSVLDELIGRCEAKMASPFKKAKPDAEVEVLAIEGEEEGESEESMDPEMLAKLVELYEQMKGD
jgi:hypothetical protein